VVVPMLLLGKLQEAKSGQLTAAVVFRGGCLLAQPCNQLQPTLVCMQQCLLKAFKLLSVDALEYR
jgi:hypothetical protein